uniref:RelA/SpoT domain-containing protein n=1 Tax=Ipomoea trifida TaxID=35884 RepID=A0A903_IPOTF|nr:hypothetical protein [Ipomoea trifida]
MRIYNKKREKLNIDEIHDIRGLRFKALRVIHQLWHEVPGRFKDYIMHPKFNGYQSLHIIFIGGGMVPLEVQIRTKEMHLQTEYVALLLIGDTRKMLVQEFATIPDKSLTDYRVEIQRMYD